MSVDWKNARCRLARSCPPSEAIPEDVCSQANLFQFNPLRVSWPGLGVTSSFPEADASTAGVRASRIGPVRSVLRAPTHGLDRVALKQNPERKHVRDEKQRYQDGHDEVGRPQLTGLESDAVALIEGVKQIRAAPNVEDPGQGDSQPARQRA
jgi:hypothetical protein